MILVKKNIYIISNDLKCKTIDFLNSDMQIWLIVINKFWAFWCLSGT